MARATAAARWPFFVSGHDMNDLLDRVPHQRRHFLFESGHHSAPWLDPGRLWLQPRPIEALTRQLAARLAPPRDLDAGRLPICARGKPLVQAFR